MKKCITLLLLFVILFLNSCNYYENVTFIEHDGEKKVLYQNEEYYETSIFTATEYYGVANENDVELGLFYSFPFSTRFYSDNSDNPAYIYSIGNYRSMFFRHDYDYSTDTFVVENTAAEIIWKDILISEKSELYYSDPIVVNLYSKQYPGIKTHLDLVCIENRWYVFLPDSEIAWIPSDEFIKILSDNGII